MEKLLEFSKGKLWGENAKYYRFQCDCLSPRDAFDVSVDSYGKDDEGKYITLTWHTIGIGLRGRLRYAWQILRQHRTWVEVTVRQEDLKYLSDIFNPDKGFSELP